MDDLLAVHAGVAGSGAIPGVTGTRLASKPGAHSVSPFGMALGLLSDEPLGPNLLETIRDPKVLWVTAKNMVESCVDNLDPLGTPCEQAERAEPLWRKLAGLLEPTNVDVGINYALTLERFHKYYDATVVWEQLIFANPGAKEVVQRTTAECTKLMSLIARSLGVPGAGHPHPNPDIEARRRSEREQNHMVDVVDDVGGAMGSELTELRHVRDDAMAVLAAADRLYLSADCQVDQLCTDAHYENCLKC